MPAKTLDEVLASLSGPEKALFENTLKNNPELKDGWLRQDDYSRKQAELDARKKTYDEGQAYVTNMEAWAEENVPKWEALAEKGIIDKETGEELWTAKEADLNRQLAEARAAAVGGGDMDPAVLKANVQAILKDAGHVTKAELDALVKEEARKLTAETFDAKYAEKEVSFNEKTVPFVTGFATSMAIMAGKFEKVTGREFTDEDTKKVFELMAEKKNFDPRKVVEIYMEPEVKKKADDAEVERRVQERLAEERKNRGGMPGSGEEPYIPQGKGNLKLMMERDAAREADKVGSLDIESAVAAAAVTASTQLRAEGKV